MFSDTGLQNYFYSALVKLSEILYSFVSAIVLRKEIRACSEKNYQESEYSEIPIP